MSESVRTRQPGIIVFICGVIFSATVLKGVDWLFEHDINIMGWYVKLIIPAGALIVGICSGLGYGVASRLVNAKLSKAFLWGMVLTGLVDYVAAQYVTYSNLPERYQASHTFFHYIQDICENMTFTRSSSSEPGSPLGVWGYAFKLLEMTGFTVGYIVPSMVVSSIPYCAGCQLYLKKHRVASLNSPVQKKEFNKMKKPERFVALDTSVNDVMLRHQQLIDRIKDASLTDTEAALSAHHQDGAKNALANVTMTLFKCPKCETHHLNSGLSHLTVDKKPASKNLLKLDKRQQQVAGTTAV